MSWYWRAAIGALALGMGAALLGSPLPALAESPDPDGNLLNEVEAIMLARETGEPVVVSALTDEHTLVTADPVTGELTAEVSAGIARVADAEGGWREPSASLVPGPNGSFVTEAGAVPVRVSSGGDGAFLTLGEGASRLDFEWPESLPTPVIEDNLATFTEVVPGVDLVVRASVDGAESYLVVKNAEAAQNPLVRSVPITLTADDLTPTVGEAGVVAYADADGEEQFWVPPAYLWDSSGQAEDASLAELLEPANGARVEAMPVEVAKAGRSAQPSGRVVVDAESTVSAVLDDPATVYPVVIDPSANGEQSYAVRVTQEFNNYNSGIGSRGKLGYNGWTSPYYKSRMYYQFRWPKLNDEPVPGNRINSAEFSYVQTHSPQHDCSNNTFGPSVKLQFHNTISSSTTWSNQPGVHTDSGSKSHDYAVGAESVCKKTYTQKWNISTMVKTERADNPTRTTVTVGLRSSDEGDKNGWREYKHTEGSSPKLTIVYQMNPSTPAVPTISHVVSGFVTSLTPTLTTSVALPSGSSCIQASCLVADFEVLGPNGTTTALTSTAVASGNPATVTVPAGKLADLTTYTVRVKARSLDHGGSSGWAQTTTKTRLNVAPPAASTLQVLNEAGSVVTGSPPLVVGSALKLRAKLPAGSLCPAETPNCLDAEFSVLQGSTVVYSATVLTGAPNDLLVTPAINVAGWDGSYTMSVRVKKSWTTIWSGTTSLAFTVKIPPAKAAVSELPTDPGKVRFRMQLNPAPLASYTYHWRVVYTDLANPGPSQTFTGTVNGSNQAEATLTLPMQPNDVGEAAVTAWVTTPAGATGPESATVPITVFG